MYYSLKNWQTGKQLVFTFFLQKTGNFTSTICHLPVFENSVMINENKSLKNKIYVLQRKERPCLKSNYTLDVINNNNDIIRFGLDPILLF